MSVTSPPASAYLAAPTKMTSAANGIDYMYREIGKKTPAQEYDARRRHECCPFAPNENSAHFVPGQLSRTLCEATRAGQGQSDEQGAN